MAQRRRILLSQSIERRHFQRGCLGLSPGGCYLRRQPASRRGTCSYKPFVLRFSMVRVLESRRDDVCRVANEASLDDLQPPRGSLVASGAAGDGDRPRRFGSERKRPLYRDPAPLEMKVVMAEVELALLL